MGIEKIKSDTNVGIPSLIAISGDTDNDMREGVAVKATASKVANSVEIKRESTEPGFVSPPKVSKMDCFVLVSLNPFMNYITKIILGYENQCLFLLGIQILVGSKNLNHPAVKN